MFSYRLCDRHEEYRVRPGGAGAPAGLEPVVFLDGHAARSFLHSLCYCDDRNCAVLRRVAAERWGGFGPVDLPERELVARLADELAGGGWAVLRKKRPDLTVDIGIASRRFDPSELPAAEPIHRLLVKVIDDETGAPIGGCRLDVSQSGGAKQRLLTRPDGVAELPGAKPGSYDVEGPFGGITLATTLVLAGGKAKGGAKKPGEKPQAAREAVSGWTIAEVKEHRVKKGDTLTSIAQSEGLSTVQLAYFNFGVYEPEQIEAALRDEVGCTHRNKDGKYVFSDADEPGIVYVPRLWTKRGVPVDVENTLRVRRVERRLPDLRFWYQIDVHSESARDDKLILEAEDGSWKHELEVKSLSEPEPGWVEAVFPSPPVGVRFLLLQDYNDGNEPHLVFAGLSYGDIRATQADQLQAEEEFENAQGAA